MSENLNFELCNSKIKAIVFDMDGVIIDSEPLWEEAELEIFNKLGVPLNEKNNKQTLGLRVDEVVEYWFERYPWDNFRPQETQEKIITRVAELVEKQGSLKQGAEEAIELCYNYGFKLGLASSSPMKLINLVLNKYKLVNKFEVVHSAEFEKYGKPHPAVYLNALKKMRVNAVDSLAIEDSVNGLLSAKSAGMRCVLIPVDGECDIKNYKRADYQLTSLMQLNQEFIETKLCVLKQNKIKNAHMVK